MPNKKVGDALAKLKYPCRRRPAGHRHLRFWKPHGEFHEVDPTKIDTEVFRPSANLFAEHAGTFTNRPRRAVALEVRGQPGSRREDAEIRRGALPEVKAMYARMAVRCPSRSST